MRDYIVSGVPLRDPVSDKYGIDYTRSSLAGDASRQISVGSDYGFHGGQTEQDNYFGVSREVIVLNILGDTITEHQQLFRGFQALFQRRDFSVITAPQRSPLAAGSGRDNRSFAAGLALREARMRANGSPGLERLDEKSCRLSFVVENVWAFYRAMTDVTSAAFNVASGTASLDLSALAGDSTAPITVGFARIKGPISSNGSVRVNDLNSGKGFVYKAAVALTATEYVLVNLETFKAYKVTTDTWAIGGTDVSASIDLMGEGSFSLDPGAPASGWPVSTFGYAASVTGTGVTGGSTAIEFRIRRSYLS